MSNKVQTNGNNIKNVRLYIPIDLYKRLKKYQAQRILDDKPEQSLAKTCLEILDSAMKDFK